MRIKIPEKYCQKFEPKVKNKVLDLINKVKTIIDKTKEQIIRTARLEIILPSSLAPISIGNKGKIHGAKTVSIPAKIEIKKNII